MIEQPITHVYSAPMGPVKSRLIIMGIPVRSHETFGGAIGNGMSNGGPGVISKTADRPPSMLARTCFLVSSVGNYVPPVEKNMLCAK